MHQEGRAAVRPRTQAERQAFLSGFAEAVLMCANESVQAAQAWLRQAVESEDRV